MMHRVAIAAGMIGILSACSKPIFERPDVPYVSSTVYEVPSTPAIEQVPDLVLLDTPIARELLLADAASIAVSPHIVVLPVTGAPLVPLATPPDSVAVDAPGRAFDPKPGDLSAPATTAPVGGAAWLDPSIEAEPALGSLLTTLPPTELLGYASQLFGFGEGPQPIGPPMIESALPRAFMVAGVDRLTLPSDLQAVVVEKESERDGRLRWWGSLDQLIRIEPVIEADVLLAIDVASASEVALAGERRYAVGDEAFARYAAAYTSYVERIDDEIRELTEQRVAYINAFELASQRYEEDGGRYHPTKPRPGDFARATYAEERQRIERRIETLERARATPVSPEQLTARAEAMTEPRVEFGYALTAQVRWIDARRMTILALGVYTARDATLAGAATQIVDEVVATTTSLVRFEPEPLVEE